MALAAFQVRKELPSCLFGSMVQVNCVLHAPLGGARHSLALFDSATVVHTRDLHGCCLARLLGYLAVEACAYIWTCCDPVLGGRCTCCCPALHLASATGSRDRVLDDSM